MANPYLISVRGLCEFAAKRGDLDTRFTPSPSAAEGIEGHALVRAKRPASYQTEVSLSASYGHLLVRGRADGFDPEAGLLEEIKTHRSTLDSLPDNQRALHWAQAHVYGHMLCLQRGLPELHIALVYFDIGSQQETVLRETRSAQELATLFASLCERFLSWAEQELLHRQERDNALAALAFPYPAFRSGQREFAEAVYTGCARHHPVMAQAPTGIGKTLGCLFPSLKAMSAGLIDKSFYLAAKTSGRALALDALGKLQQRKLRVLELVARDKACQHPAKACHGESCPLAKGFYDRLPQARCDAAEAMQLDQAALASIAARHQICPYYLGSEMARWSDVVIGDYNYYFDYGGMLYALTLDRQWQVQVLVDEAHNLVPRARAMYSTEVTRPMVRAAKKAAPPSLKKSLGRLDRAWKALPEGDYAVLDTPPAAILSDLQSYASAVTELLAQQSAPLPAEIMDLYFQALQTGRLADSFGEHALCDSSRQQSLSIRNVVPAPYLRPRFAAARSVLLFSATLSPWHYVSDALGLPENSAWIDIPSPFSANQLDVQIAHRVSTRFQERAASVPAIVDIIGRGYAEKPGNYLVFFSSFDYLQQVATAFAHAWPDIPIWLQTRGMSETERTAFVARFQADSCGIGFAVLGGAFGEGIDLPGARLIGAWIATLGLPQYNPVNEQFRQRLHTLFGAGYDYAYLYPGLQKVVQAAGRVIRSEDDRGMVCLIDDRFARPEVRALLPAWWQPRLIE